MVLKRRNKGVWQKSGKTRQLGPLVYPSEEGRG